ncbi:MAG: hypothetical protein L0Y44_01155 [Phycisphaerales bacterium]|nr:hypothetical protein [Phycisphaerales bacterium]
MHSQIVAIFNLLLVLGSRSNVCAGGSDDRIAGPPDHGTVPISANAPDSAPPTKTEVLTKTPSAVRAQKHKNGLKLSTTAVGHPAPEGGIAGGPEGDGNDTCAGATTLTLGVPVTDTTVGMGIDTVPACALFPPLSPGVWFSVVGNGTTLTASTCSPLTTYDSALTVFCGSCDSLECVGGNDDFCGLQTQFSWCSVPGQTYYILVFGFATNAGPFQITVTSGAPCTPPQPPANDDCRNAQLIACESTTEGTNIDATDDGLFSFCSFGGAPTNSDVWYRFDAMTNTMTASTCSGGSLGDSVLSIYDAPCGTALGCNDDSCGLRSSVTVSNLTFGNTYWIRVAGWNDTEQGTFELNLACGTPMGACCVLGSCEIRTQASCQLDGGNYQGDGVACPAVTCTPMGACCVSSSCEIRTQASCQLDGGNYQGDGVACPPITYAVANCTNPLQDISTTGTLAPNASNCDDCSDLNIPIGFSFPYFGNIYNTIRICSNGFLSFDQAGPNTFNNVAIPFPEAPNDIVCPFWDDFRTDALGNGDVFYQILSNPTRFVVQWNQVRRFGETTGANTFQAILFATSDIEFRYGALEGSPPLSGSVGIENSDGTLGVSIDPTPIGFGNTCRHLTLMTPCGCPTDVSGDGVVNVDDLLAVISAWGSCPPGSCPADIAPPGGDGVVNVDDLLAVISAWGACP